MNFKILTIKWFSAYGIYNVEEIDVEGLDIFAIAQKINLFNKKRGEIASVELH